jgi:hypothetical protein
MKIQALISILVLSSILSIDTNIAVAEKNQPLNIGYIKNIANGGPACWYWRAGEKGRSKNVLNNWVVSGGAAIINLNGKDIRLKTVKPWKIYNINDIKVYIKTTSTPSSNGEVTDKGTIVITKGSKSRTINVEGYCGV